MDKPLLVVISGPSGAGKGTIVKRLLEICPEIKLSISATTREPRNGEQHGINYFFISKQEFKEMIDNDKFLEYAQAYDNYYGTPEEYVCKWLKTNDVVLEIEMQGAMKVKKKASDALLIFVAPPSLDELYERLKGRKSETPEQLKKRTDAARSEIDKAKDYDYIVVNDEIDIAAQKVKSIIEAHKCRYENKKDFLKVLKEGTIND